MTILVSSANATTRERWKQILQGDHQLLEAVNVAELKNMTQQHPIALILLHRSMVDMNLITSMTKSRFFVLSDIPDDKEAFTLLRLGAIGYANTYISASRLREAVNTALSGRVWVAQRLMQKIIRGTTHAINRERTDMPLPPNLSEREWEVALLVSKGNSNLEIAAELDISERTVKAHISSLFKKTKTESRLQLALQVKNLIS